MVNTSIIHHKLPSNTPIDPLPLGLLIAAWALLMLLILALNLPLMYIFYATDQLQSSRAKYIFTMLLSDVLLALIIPLRIVGLRGHLSPYKTVCHGIQYLEQVLITVNLYIILSMSMIRKKYISRGLGYRQGPTETNVFLFLIWIISFFCSARVPLLVGEPEFHDPDVPDALVCLSSIGNTPRVYFHEFIVDYILPISAMLFLSRSAKNSLSRQKLREVEIAVLNKRHSRGIRMILTLILCTALLHLPKHILIIYGFLQDDRGRAFYMVNETFQLLVYATGVSNVVVYLIFNRTSAPVFISFVKNKHHSLFFKDESADRSVNDPRAPLPSSKHRKKYSSGPPDGTSFRSVEQTEGSYPPSQPTIY
ncbi:uncharacterized protein LOC112557233 isoform X2 [Pomacea canaliculata]|uniref:uncharacterized protein LOC112557233 isoform X2 n=1 Tax=Pomacea canaliculata TaxID=400727 RepID=UPI000D72EF0F|nr:uncharacterized protein LOC112557233 isoform X2 [Pomacea canaliculata]